MLHPLCMRACCAGLVFAQLVSVIAAQTHESVSKYAELIPQHLLGLVHAPQSQQELQLTDVQVQQLEALFAEIDTPWFQLRILPAEKQRELIVKLEQRVRNWFQENTSAAQQTRLDQLECRAQGVRMLLRQDVKGKLKLESSQQEALAELARAANAATQKLHSATMKNAVTDELTQEVSAAIQAEQKSVATILRPEQLQQLKPLLGDPFDTAQLKRIYPLAPELVSVEHWINSEPLTLQQLRGKVVLVHFYAFQCHNCHANFDHYKNWSEKYNSDEVVVIGIQSPETSRERDPQAVREAAAESGLQFPILIDLESENWKKWSNTMWPTVYVIDKQGYLRHWWQGELNWQGATGDKTIEDLVSQLLQEDTPT